MRILETPKFLKLRKKLREDEEREALREAVLNVIENPESGKRLKGELKDLCSLRYTVRGQARRLIYKHGKDVIVFFSFGLRQGIYK